MRSAQEDNPEGVLKQAMVLGFDACPEKGLSRYKTLISSAYGHMSTYFLHNNATQRVSNE